MFWVPLAIAATQLIGGYHSAEIIREQAKLKKRIDDMNAEDAQIDVFNAIKSGQSEAAQYQHVIDSTVGDQRVGYASQNVDVGYGTAADLQKETKVIGGLNLIDIQNKARERAYGLQHEIRNTKLGAEFKQQQANIDAAGAERQGLMSALQTGLTGYARYGGKSASVGNSDYSADPEVGLQGQRRSSNVGG